MKSLVKSIYINERRKALVNGCISLYTQAQNIQDEPKYRNTQFSIPLLQFKFNFIMPQP